MPKYMTANDIFLDFKDKINCTRQFEMITEEEKQAIIENGINKIVRDLYDLSLSKITCLSQRDTYIIRKLYGVLNYGKCIPGPVVKAEFNLSNIHSIKQQFFKRVNLELEKFLISYNFSKKKKETLELIGIELNLFKLNLVAFNHNSKMLNFDEYVENTPMSVVNQEVVTIKIYIRSIDELKLADLTDIEIQITLLHFGLNTDHKQYSLREIAPMLKMSRENARLISKSALEKLKNHFSNPLKSDYFDTIECLNLSTRPYNSLKKAGINTMEQLLDLSEPELINIPRLGKKSLDELYQAIQNYKSVTSKRQAIIDTRNCLLEELQALQERKRRLEQECQELDFEIAQAQVRYEKFEESELIKKRTYKL